MGQVCIPASQDQHWSVLRQGNGMSQVPGFRELTGAMHILASAPTVIELIL